MLLKTIVEIWDTLKEVYNNEKNISRVFELYERLFTLEQGEMSIMAYYSVLHGILDELEIHQPLVIDSKDTKEITSESHYRQVSL